MMRHSRQESRPGTGTEAAKKPDEAFASLSNSDDYTTSPRCSPAVCATANAATADLLARYRVSAASRDVCDEMVSSGLLERVRESIGQPVTPEQWIAFYERRAAELKVKLDARRRAREAGVGS